jgi:F-type H+-transporting ATPase subunit a
MPHTQGQPQRTTLPPIRLAQNATYQAESRAAFATTAGPIGETVEKHKAGEIPDARLLFMNSILCALLLIAFALAARRKLALVPRGFQNFAEMVIEWIENTLTVGIIGPEGKKYTPLVGTIFLYIVLMNVIGLIPGFHSPTSNLSVTLALGVCVFVYVQFEGIRQNGLLGYLKHFCGPMLPLLPLMLPVELISELVKPFTLAVRLFGNIFGEDVIIGVLAGLVGSLGLSAFGWIPVQTPLVLLALLTSFVQALVFSILTCIYLSLMSHHGHDEHSEEGEEFAPAH